MRKSTTYVFPKFEINIIICLQNTLCDFYRIFCRHLYINTIENNERMFYNDYIATRNVWDERVVCMDKDTEYCVEMTKEEYRLELQKMLAGVDDERLLRYFYIFVSEKLKRVS